jgi:cyclohexa-1,5-dienecarbonyl-CoA hydratase
MPVLFEIVDRAAFLTLSRPPLNVLDTELLRELDDRLARVQRTGGVDFVVLRGEGPRAFSAGVDVKDHTREKAPAMLEAVHAVVRRLIEQPQVTIAAVDGACLGGGLEIASCCDLVVATEQSFFATPEITVGCYPPVALARFAFLIGYHPAAELVLTGKRLSAAEAKAAGLVNRVAGAEGLDAAVESLLAELREKSAAVLRLAVRGLREMAFADFARRLKHAERLYLDELLETEDVEEGVRAFLEKREPRWRHR